MKIKKCMIKIINYFYNIYICLINENIIFYIGKTMFDRPHHCIYIINYEYFIRKYWDCGLAPYTPSFNPPFAPGLKLGRQGGPIDYNFITNNDDDYLFSVMSLIILKHHTNNYKLCENIISLFNNREHRCVKICETIQKNIINELMNANIIIDYSLRDKNFKFLSDTFICYGYGYDYNGYDILNHIFGFIPKAIKPHNFLLLIKYFIGRVVKTYWD